MTSLTTTSTRALNPFSAPISEEIWDMKYRHKDHAGTMEEFIHDATVQDTWKRVATALAKAEPTEKLDYWRDQFMKALEDFKFLPAGRIIAGTGTDRNVTLFNCYVMGTIPDSMSGIFDMLKEAALTMQQGGGIGYDFSTIRPKNAPVKGVAADASGPLTFMDVWDAMCRTVMSAGSRRGAMMATMRCDHPDVLQFVEAKQDAARLRMFNMSVLVTDDFMAAVENDEDWELAHEVAPTSEKKMKRREDGKYVYGTVPAREMWDRIMRSTYDYAEPGVIFIDRINRDNNLNYMENISATNPCGEQPLPPYGACLLGSINLTRFVKNAFQVDAEIDARSLEHTVKMAVRMMDNVNDVSKFPLREQLAEAQKKRRIGLGVTGLADMLVMMGVRYDSEAGAALAEQVMKQITLTAYWTSVHLAEEKGSFPAFDADGYLAEGTFASRLPEDLKQAIRQHGIRNSHLTSIAPTGTISLYAGNVSSGVEPIFATSYNRKVLQPDGSKTEQRVEDYAVALWNRQGGGSSFGELPETFTTAQDMTPFDHIRMQAAIQPWIDTSISKTVNVPKDISFEDFVQVYNQAFKLGCKGCTTYRPNDVTGSVISVDDEPTETVSEVVADAPLEKRPEVLDGKVYKIKFGTDEHALYVTITDVIDNGKRRPFEIFINSKNMEHFAWTVALTRMISAVFRRPHDSSFVAEELKAVFDPKGGAWMSGRYVPSVLAAIGGVIETHMRDIGYIVDEVCGTESEQEVLDDVIFKAAERPTGPSCSKCGSYNMKHESGCTVCGDCGYSACG